MILILAIAFILIYFYFFRSKDEGEDEKVPIESTDLYYDFWFTIGPPVNTKEIKTAMDRSWRSTRVLSLRDVDLVDQLSVRFKRADRTLIDQYPLDLPSGSRTVHIKNIVSYNKINFGYYGDKTIVIVNRARSKKPIELSFE